MDSGNVANVSSVKLPYAFKIWQIGRYKGMACIVPDYMLSLRFCLKLDENCGSSSLNIGNFAKCIE